MATLHLPKNRPPRKESNLEEKAERSLDAGLKGTFPASDPVAITIPGGVAQAARDPERSK